MKSMNRPELVREYNMEVLRKALYSARQASRQQLSRTTGISSVTLGGLLRELIESGEAYEGDQEPSDGGRPIHTYCYNASFCSGLFILAQFERGEYVFKSGLVNSYGELISERKRKASRMDEQQTYRFIKGLMKTGSPVKAVGVGLPGVGISDYIHGDTGECNLSLKGLEAVQKEMGIPVMWENDINLAVLGFAGSHKVPAGETVAYFYLMKGAHAGAAVYLNGGVHLGMGRFAGEMLSFMSGVKWEEAETENTGAVTENLFKLLFPYVCILAPNKIVIASDYIKSGVLKNVRAKIASLTGAPYCPDFMMTKDFYNDYASGVRRMVLEKIAVSLL